MDIVVRSRNEAPACEGTLIAYWLPAEGAPKLALPSFAAGALDAQEFTGASGQMALLRLPVSARGPARVVLLLGLGEPAKASRPALAGAYAQAFGALKAARCKTVSLDLSVFSSAPGLSGGPDAGGAFGGLGGLYGLVASQVVMADYAFDKYKPAPQAGEPQKPAVSRVDLLVPAAELASARARVSRAVSIAQAANFTRALQNEPGNVATPSWVATQAQSAAKKRKNLTVRVLGRPELEREKMNAMLAVAGASAQEPRLVVLEYRGASAHKGWDAAVVGKGVTFDSGGISIKPSQKMDEMKFDKSGACAAIGALLACADLSLPLNVAGVAALVENMPDAQSYRPGDILTASNGLTIEVLNTDAEGRLVLADALAWTAQHYAPGVMVDLATLTGAAAVALGDLASALLSEDDALASGLAAAGEATGERLWRLPLWPEYDEKIKSEVAAVKNVGEPGQAGTIAGASFLKRFAGEGRWAHLDIAATAYGSKPRAGLAPGGYGTGVRLLAEYLSRLPATPAQGENKRK